MSEPSAAPKRWTTRQAIGLGCVVAVLAPAVGIAGCFAAEIVGVALNDAYTRGTAGPSRGSPAATAQPVELLSSTGYERRAYHLVEGQVRNASPAALPGVIVVTDWFDASHHLVTSSDAVIDTSPLEPGDTATFTTMAETRPGMVTYTIRFRTAGGRGLGVKDLRPK